MSVILSQSNYAKKLYEAICEKLGVELTQKFYKYEFPENCPIKCRTMEGLRDGNLSVISLTRLNAICEFFEIEKPQFLNSF